MLFVQDIESNQLKNVFVAQHDTEKAEEFVHVVYAESGYVSESPDGSQKLILTQGNQYEGTLGQRDYRVVDCQIQISLADESGEQQRHAFPPILRVS